MSHAVSSFLRLTALLGATILPAPAGPSSAVEPPVSYAFQIRPLLSDRCFFCHGPDEANQKAGLRLDVREAATAAREDGAVPVKPGDPDHSEIIRRIESEDPEEIMPPPDSHRSLSPEERALIRRWIAEGAVYEPHWAFTPPVKAPVPALPPDLKERARTPVDAFLFAKARDAGLPVAPDAPRAAWLRRVSFGLTGLPPSPEELEAFLADPSPDALDRAVDRLTKSPAFAERLALDWLDAARFADTYGYQADRPNHLWPWRDWVLRSFQNNKPFDQFLTEQIAGDLLPGATTDQILATAFNRLHRMTNEGGSVPEEFRLEGVADRVNTLGYAVLGLTLECARCHDHKYDPVSTRNYYQLSAFFDNIDEFGLYAHFNDAEPTPALTLYRDGAEAKHAELKARIAEAELTLAKTFEEAAKRFPGGEPQLPEPVAAFDFDEQKDGGFANTVETDKPLSGTENPGIVEGRNGRAVAFDGDSGVVSREGVARFGRADAFTFSLWVKPLAHKPKMVVLHRCAAEQDAASQGYELLLDDGHPVFSLIHFWPGDAIRVRAKERLPVNEWTHLAVGYDGSSRAAGARLYANGKPLELEIVKDHLTRGIGDAAFAMGSRFRDVGFQGAMDELRVFDRVLTPLEISRLAGVAAPSESGDAPVIWARDHDAAVRAAAERLAALRREEDALISSQPAIMVMREMPERRRTFIRQRGAYDAPGEEVTPGVPEFLALEGVGHPQNRLELARWLTHPRHPLTARVYVNRIWQMLFGRGLVATTNDFGSQGSLPSHPELLDWLAREFIDGGWDVRALCRLIASSAVYRLSSTPLPEQREKDPENVFLTRFPRHRLPAELVRDHALAVSGLLVKKTGGPSAKPYQPKGLWEESGTGATYVPDAGEGLYRRSLYTFIKRTAPPANMLTFDSHSREVCVVKRETTNTPLQALVLLNDPQFVEAARALAAKRQAIPDIPGRLRALFAELTGAEPTERELEILTAMRARQLAHFQADPARAEAFVSVGAAPLPDNIDLPQLAADASVVLALMSHDSFVTVR